MAEVVECAEFTAILTKYVKYYGSFEEALKHLDKYAEDEYSIFTTDKNGHGVSSLLAYGHYTVNETYTPSAEINTVEEFYITIDKDSEEPIKEIIANDTPFEGYIRIQKKDKETGKLITYSNATFELHKLNKTTNEWEKVTCKVGNKHFNSWTTNEAGIAYTETKIKAGKYKITEISVPNSFVKLDEEIIFELNNDIESIEYDADWDAFLTIDVFNEKAKGEINLSKTINLKDDIDKTLIEDIDFTKISFGLYAKEDIIDYIDGSTIYSKDAHIGTYNLNEDGTLKIDDLNLGCYYLKELSTIDGAVLDTTEYEVLLKQEDSSQKEILVNLNIKNETTLVEISKFDITGEKELEGASLRVLDQEGNIIDEWISTDVAHKIEGLKVGETYILREEISPEGYVKSNDISFTIVDTEVLQKVYMVDKMVEISKVDIGGVEIEGASLQVLDLQGKIIDEWVSTKNVHKVSGLVEGEKYILHEEICIDGYVKATDIEFVVTTGKETQTIQMIDKIVEIIKTDFATGEELEGAHLQVVDENGNVVDEWISTREPHRIKGLEEGKTYTLIEKIAPYGYEIAEDITFTVSLEKETQKIEMKDKYILTDIRLVKIDEDTKEIIKDKFTFGLYVDQECTQLIQQMDSNKKDGTILFEDVKCGEYFIKEISAPKNYQLSDKVVKIVINENGVTADDQSLLNDNDGIYSFTFANQAIPEIHTGTNISHILLFSMIGISIVGIIVCIILINKKKLLI